MRVSNLRTLNMENPLGIGKTPYFSWMLESDDKDIIQLAYELTVKEAGEGPAAGRTMWDTGRIESRDTAYIGYAGMPLESRKRYVWEVNVRDNKGNREHASAEFGTALLKTSDWQAKWAKSALPSSKRKKGFGKQPPATMFRKSFNLKEQAIASARLYATCHGIYRLTVNGKRADDREFAPEHTVYGKYLCYQTYDITNMLRQGENALGMYVGDGWYCGMRTKPKHKEPGGFSAIYPKGVEQVHAVLFQLEVTYEDGSRETIISDGSVKTAYGAIRFSDLFSGEKYDATLELTGWDDVGFDDSLWANAVPAAYSMDNLTAQLGQPVVPVALLPAKEVFTSPRGEKIIDFGQVIAGRVRMNINAPEGTEIIINHYEVLDKDGNCFDNLHGLGGGTGNEQRDIYISNGKPSCYEPYFTFHGFRYICVTGLPDIRKDDFTAVALSSQKENLGEFSCSDERLTRLYENTRWSQRSNMLSIPTDCPHREKAGWTGDIQIYAVTSLQNEETTPFLTRWLENLACDQFENGGVPFVVPNAGLYPFFGRLAGRVFGNDGEAASAGWGDAAVLVPYDMYRMTGNTAILRQQYNSMKKWCDYVIHTAETQRGKRRKIPKALRASDGQTKKGRRGRKIPKDIDRYLWNTGFHFGEWLIPSLSRNGYGLDVLTAVKASLQYTAPVYAYCSVSAIAEIAKVLDKEEDSTYYSGMAEKIRDAIAEGVIDENGEMPVPLMGAYVLPIYFDLVPERHKEHFADKLVSMIESNGGCLDTGFLGTPFILDALCKIGREDMAYALLYQEKCPSWLYEVNCGATTIWESWYGYTEDDMPMIISYNHYAFGCVSDWMFRYICGIDKSEPGFKHIVINPKPDDSLSWAKRSYRSAHGTIICNWQRKNGEFRLETKIPCNTTATIKLPDGESFEVGSGSYAYTCKC